MVIMVTSDPDMYAAANANIGPSDQTKQILKTIQYNKVLLFNPPL